MGRWRAWSRAESWSEAALRALVGAFRPLEGAKAVSRPKVLADSSSAQRSPCKAAQCALVSSFVLVPLPSLKSRMTWGGVQESVSVTSGVRFKAFPAVLNCLKSAV